MRHVFAVLALATGLALAQSDDHIYDKVRLRLAGDPAVNGGALQVEVKDGAVTLRGNVKNEKAREKAEKHAKKVKGVKSVTNELKVDPNAH